MQNKQGLQEAATPQVPMLEFVLENEEGMMAGAPQMVRSGCGGDPVARSVHLRGPQRRTGAAAQRLYTRLAQTLDHCHMLCLFERPSLPLLCIGVGRIPPALCLPLHWLARCTALHLSLPGGEGGGPAAQQACKHALGPGGWRCFCPRRPLVA